MISLDHFSLRKLINKLSFENVHFMTHLEMFIAYEEKRHALTVHDRVSETLVASAGGEP